MIETEIWSNAEEEIMSEASTICKHARLCSQFFSLQI